VAIGDVHGAYDALVATLQAADIIDDNLAWSGAASHLVFTGDLLDRGARSRLVLDLVIRLEREAPRSDGRVHMLLGNHEVMNLTGDLRYVADEEYAAFQDLESPAERELWYEHFRSNNSADGDEVALRQAFDKKAPPGYFGHRRAFRHDGYYGSWLLTKPFMVVVNGTAFVHGGAPPMIAEQGLAGVNVALKKELYDYVATRDGLADRRFMSPVDRFKEIRALFESRRAQDSIPPELVDDAQRVLDLTASALHGSAGPTWYRGTATCSALIEGDALHDALGKIGAERIVVGHTTTITRRVQQRMNGHVVEIDTGMLSSTYKGSGNALVIDDGELSVVSQHGITGMPPSEHPVRVGHESDGIDDGALAGVLMTGDVVNLTPSSPGWQLLRIQGDKKFVTAIFHEIAEEQSFIPELAAFKLDRLLGLNMVPVTVRREVAGQWGIVQYVPDDTFSERERAVGDRLTGADCPYAKQIAAMLVFDTFINNPTRSPSAMLYGDYHWSLILVDHDQAFDAGTDQLTRSQGVDVAIGDQWRTALRRLDDALLDEELADVLDTPRLEALKKRRDTLVEK